MYLRHEQISEDPIFVSYIPRVIGIAKKKLGKVSFSWQGVADSFRAVNQSQALKYLKIGTCPASQKLLAFMEKMLTYIGNHPKFHLPCSLRHS